MKTPILNLPWNILIWWDTIGHNNLFNLKEPIILIPQGIIPVFLGATQWGWQIPNILVIEDLHRDFKGNQIIEEPHHNNLGQLKDFNPKLRLLNQAPPLPTLEALPPPNWVVMMEMMVKSQLQSEERFRQVTERLDQLSAHNKMLENQLANQASTSSTKVTGKLPACPENSREHVNAIVTRSGKKLEEPPLPVDKPMPSKIIDVEIEEKLEEEEANPPVLNSSHQGHENDEREKPERKYVPPLPFPQKFQRQAKDSRWKKFLDIVENLKVSIPLLDLLTQTPSYGKFLREILSKKRKFGDQEMIAMTQEYWALTREEGRFPTKLRDPGIFTIPCVIGGSTINRSLCDLGVSVNVMPLSLCKKLNLGEPQPVELTLQFADRSTKNPIGILEDVLVRVDKYFVPCDFVVMDI
ncbi:uncharacterized protein LOC116010011 [Ipomoea triloba]|uniref:uncharacterized protein LOC116010011 n=1 Tax=Ipomoea triloba TaxID=35885 RepID=UPI00125D7EC6|nr:uncharacterized protein LOC116010011 [Ipomoea triloba]